MESRVQAQFVTEEEEVTEIQGDKFPPGAIVRKHIPNGDGFYWVQLEKTENGFSWLSPWYRVGQYEEVTIRDWQ